VIDHAPHMLTKDIRELLVFGAIAYQAVCSSLESQYGVPSCISQIRDHPSGPAAFGAVCVKVHVERTGGG
jgi:hypothetical protein